LARSQRKMTVGFDMPVRTLGTTRFPRGGEGEIFMKFDI